MKSMMRCREIKSIYKVSGEEVKDLEESTRLQSKSKVSGTFIELRGLQL